MERSLILHDLQRDLIHKRREKDLPGLHLRLVEAWDALPKLPDTYAWRWVGVSPGDRLVARMTCAGSCWISIIYKPNLLPRIRTR